MQISICNNNYITLTNGSAKLADQLVLGDQILDYQGNTGIVASIDKIESDAATILQSKNNINLFLSDSNYCLGVDSSNGIKGATSISPTYINNFSIGNLVASPIIEKFVPSNLTTARSKLLGYFAAEGSYPKKYGKRQGVQFTVGINEQLIANHIKDLFEEDFPECSIKINPEPERSVINVTATGYNIAEFFYKHVGEYSHQKTLSNELVFSNRENKIAFLSAWLEGDGCISDNNKLIGITASTNMAWQIKMMLNSLQISSSIRITPGKSRVINKKYEASICRDSYRIEVSGTGYQQLYSQGSYKYNFVQSKHKNINQFFKNFNLHYVKKVEILPIKSYIFNLKIDNLESILLNGLVVC